MLDFFKAFEGEMRYVWKATIRWWLWNLSHFSSILGGRDFSFESPKAVLCFLNVCGQLFIDRWNVFLSRESPTLRSELMRSRTRENNDCLLDEWPDTGNEVSPESFATIFLGKKTEIRLKFICSLSDVHYSVSLGDLITQTASISFTLCKLIFSYEVFA
jgi:hypothetical protein